MSGRVMSGRVVFECDADVGGRNLASGIELLTCVTGRLSVELRRSCIFGGHDRSTYAGADCSARSPSSSATDGASRVAERVSRTS